MTLLGQYLPEQYEAVRSGRIGARASDLVLHRVEKVLQQYRAACTDETSGS
jgi:D-tagatose-1,6-bisphosphate aldolase subunit GatZ/KbaZ